MPTPLPTPIAAALGLVPTVLTGVLRLPGKALTLPFYAINNTLSALDTLRREYDELAERGERLADRFRGGAAELAEDFAERVDDLADGFEDASRGFHVEAGVTLQAVRDSVETVADRVADTASAVEDITVETAEAVASGLRDEVSEGAAADGEAAEGEVPEAEQPKGAPTPKAPEADTVRVDTAAAPEVVRTVEQVVAQSSVPEVVDHDELPLPDYDHMTLGSLRGRLRSLSVDQLAQVRAYEKAHADRLPVVTMLDNRIAKLALDAAAAPSGPVSTEPAPEQRASNQGGSKVSAATRQTTVNPVSPAIAAGADQRAKG